MPKIKNIIIFIVIGAILVLIYIFFIRSTPAEEASLVSSFALPPGGDPMTMSDNSMIANEFLTLLLNVKNIRLNDAIFSDQAFISLRDSSIVLIPDGNEGRVNPFAPLGTDIITPPTPPTPIPNTGAPLTP